MCGIIHICLERLSGIPQGFRLWLFAGVIGTLLTPGLTLAAAPVIDDFSASAGVVLPGGTITLTVDAHDPDCAGTCTSGCGLYIRSDLTDWSATGGTLVAENDGVSASPYTASADWQAPDVEATYTITVDLADSGSFLCGGRQSTSASLDIQVTTSTNQPPVVESLTVNPALLFPGETSNLLCIASDPEGDPVAYSWSTDAGSITPGATGTAVFTGSVPGIATVTCTATDSNGGFGSDSIGISVSGAQGEKTLDAALVTPQRLAADSWGNLYVVDRTGGGLAVVNLLSGELVYRLQLLGLSSVAVDWADHLLLGGRYGAEVRSRSGQLLMSLIPGAPLGDVSDVAVDTVHQRYGVLHRSSGRVVVYDAGGGVYAAFGSTGDGPGQLKSPQGLAVTASGEWVVADTGHGEIKVFDASGLFLRSFGEWGGGAGEFVQLDDVAVDASGIIYASDTFQSWVQAFNPTGSPRETLGTYGEEVGEFKTPTGVAVVESMDRVLVASLNSSSLQVFVTSGQAPVAGPEPQGLLSSSSLTFPSQAVGSVSAAQTVTLTNTGDAQLGIRRVVTAGDFQHVTDCGAFLDPGGVCSFDLTFAPTEEGSANGSMSLDTSAADGLLTIALAGTAFVPPGVNLSRTGLQFGDQPVGTLSEPRSVALTNSGTVSLAISSISVAGEFVQMNDCPATLAAGSTCEITVRFAPQTVNDHLFGAITIHSDGVGSPHAIQLEGSGVPGLYLLAIDDATVDEGDGTAAIRVRLSAPSDGSISVDVFTSGDTAAEGEDYQPVTTTLGFGAGSTEQVLTVDVIDDSILEPYEEAFFVELANPIGATLDDDQAIATILDDELCPGPNLLANPSAEVAGIAQEIPGWSQDAGQSWFIGSAPPEPVDGEAYFAAGGALQAQLYQDVDVSGFAQQIDVGQQQFRLEAWIRCITEDSLDQGWIEIEYRDAFDSLIGAFSTSRLVCPANWQLLSESLEPPPATRSIRVQLMSEQVTGPTTDVLFDALDLHPLRTPTVVAADVAEYEGDSGTVEFPFAVRLACPYWQSVTVDFATADGSAVAGEDYLPESGSLTLPPGSVEDQFLVQVIGDEIDEGHESFEIGLALTDPVEAVLIDSWTLGLIVNDDYCAQGVGCWKKSPEAWPVDQLVMGGVIYDRPALEALLNYRGKDAAAKLARQLVATLFNLEMGSDPAVWPLVAEADAFLTLHPPGTQPVGAEEAVARQLKDQLEAYNDEGPCRLN